MPTSVNQNEMVVDTPLRSRLAFLINFTLGGKCSLHNSQDGAVVERREVEGKKAQIDFLLNKQKQLVEGTAKQNSSIYART